MYFPKYMYHKYNLNTLQKTRKNTSCQGSRVVEIWAIDTRPIINNKRVDVCIDIIDRNDRKIHSVMTIKNSSPVAYNTRWYCEKTRSARSAQSTVRDVRFDPFQCFSAYFSGPNSPWTKPPISRLSRSSRAAFISPIGAAAAGERRGAFRVCSISGRTYVRTEGGGQTHRCFFLLSRR